MNDRKSSCILVVGSGGIGCELLKNLSLSNYTNVEVIDLDTIDVSNLNRQFLFRPWHVGKPKCEVACEAARAMSAHSKSSDPKCGFYTPHHGDVTDNARFGLPFFKRFDIVLNALDNVAARRHVNRLCISAGKPLIEAGTTGYLGQSTVIVPKVTECYECQPKPAQKVYPICTIRSTPSQPVHCVVWAKEAFKLLFGDASDSMLFEDTSAADSEPSTFMGPCVDSRPAINPPPSASDLHAYASDALTSLFSTEITKQLGMDRYKTSKKPPVAIDVAGLLPPSFPQSPPSQDKKAIPDVAECLATLLHCIQTLYASPPSQMHESLTFDKDDKVAMSFVSAATALRCHTFHIPKLSEHDCKGVAGNIVPAIAATNAVVAGMQVLEMGKVLDGKAKDCKFTYCLRAPTRKGYFLQPTPLLTPNPKCYACNKASVTLYCDPDTMTLEVLLKEVIKGGMSFVNPALSLGDSEIYLADEEDYEVNLPKVLSALPAGGLKDGGMLLVEDFDQDMEVQIQVDEWKEFGEEEKQWKLGGDKPKKKEPEAAEAAGGEKRRREDGGDEEAAGKKRKGEEGVA